MNVGPELALGFDRHGAPPYPCRCDWAMLGSDDAVAAGAIHNPFFYMAPDFLRLPLVLLATAAASPTARPITRAMVILTGTRGAA